MVVFDIGWNRRGLWKKSEVKMAKFSISGQFSRLVPVPRLPIALIFGILTLLSSNLNTEGIGTLIND